MAEKEYIEREALIAQYDKEHVGAPGRARQLMVEAPTADVVKVVRCKDCIHREVHPDGENAYYLTCNLKWGLSGTVAIEDYCSYGKRKEAPNDKQKT